MKIRTLLPLLLLVCLATAALRLGRPSMQKIAPVASGAVAKQQTLAAYSKLPLLFENNKGQTDARVKFLSRGGNYTLFLTDSEAVLVLRKTAVRHGKPGTPAPTPDSTSPIALRMKLLGANSSAKVSGLEQMLSKSNYFIGRDPKKWRSNIPTYARVQYKEIYRGIDLVYYGDQGRLEYDFRVAPQASTETIKLGIEGAQELRVDGEGNLVARARDAEVLLQKPVIYQEIDGVRKHIDGGFVLRSQRVVAFEVGPYDTDKALVIDPVLSYSTYLGGSSDEPGVFTTAVDAQGNAYVTGVTLSTDFPVTPGAFQPTFGGTPPVCEQVSYLPCGDAFVTKINPSGSAVTYSTYLGGSDSDYAFGVVVDGNGNAYLAGSTMSTDFPTTPGSFQPTFGGTPPVCDEWLLCGDAFVTKLNAAGSALVYSTYLGGLTNEYAEGIAIDRFGNAYVAGYTDSADFPTTPGAFQPNYVGGPNCGTGPKGGPRPCDDAFVSKLNPAGTRLVYSTYLGGTSDEPATAIAVDKVGHAFVVGYTSSADFPVTANAFQPKIHPGQCGSPPSFQCNDAFVTELNTKGSGLVYSTYLGGSGWDTAYAIALDSSGAAYVTGLTPSANFPVTPGAFQTTIGGGVCNSFYGVNCSDGYVAKIATSKSGRASLVYSTYLGGNQEDAGAQITLDPPGNAYLTGWTFSPNFPTADALQPTNAGGNDAFVAKLNPAGSKLLFSTYLGGSGDDQGSGIALHQSGTGVEIFVSGPAFSTDFPTTSRAFQRDFRGGTSDYFVARISPAQVPGVSAIPSNLAFGDVQIGTTSPPLNVTLRNVGTKSLVIQSISVSPLSQFDRTNTCSQTLEAGESCTVSVTLTPTKIGVIIGTLSITDNASDSPQKVSLAGNGT